VAMTFDRKVMITPFRVNKSKLKIFKVRFAINSNQYYEAIDKYLHKYQSDKTKGILFFQKNKSFLEGLSFCFLMDFWTYAIDINCLWVWIVASSKCKREILRSDRCRPLFKTNWIHRGNRTKPLHSSNPSDGLFAKGSI